jgi:zinc protease
VKQFFRLYYAPNNATLVIVGDFDPTQAKAWIAKYFGDIPRGKPITRPKIAPAVLPTEKRLTFEDHVQVPRLHIQWPTVNFHSEDQYALDVLSDILTGSRIARLTKAMVYDTQTATSVFASQNSNEGVGEFDLIITPRPGHTLTEMEDQADAIVETFKRDGPTSDELKRAKAGLELSFLNELQSNLNKAFRLANDQVFYNDPTYSITVDFPKTQAVTAADVKRVANKYLGKARIVLSNVPLGKTELAARADKSTVVTDPYTEKTTEIKP